MFKKLLIVLAFVTLNGLSEANATVLIKMADECIEITACPYDGYYSRTNHYVSVYTESGHNKGRFAVYLHNGNRYIRFNNTWICIQGRSRFFYTGNWYVIK